MNDELLDQLGQIIIQDVRDTAITNWDGYLEGKFKGTYAQKMYTLLSTADKATQDLIRDLIPRVVDETLIIFLQTLDRRTDKLELTVKNSEKNFSVYGFTEDLSSEYETQGGWLERFSRQRKPE
ncbi:hypothetical protein Q0M94_15110 [Deinococcus radiomollis]|uniref:hypothetical protein n=1 Tax=Deinococcus radiomollis TaxID=468916 RepID=UPI003891F91F